MGPLKVASAALALLVAVPATAANVERWRPIIAEASLRFGIPEAWIVRVMRAESGGNTMLNGAPITSRAGAMGLMQVMPDTYRAMAAAQGLGPNPFDPRDNILAGAAYLRAMYDLYGYPGLFAAYNAGPSRYDEYLRGGRSLPLETRAYVAQLADHGPRRAGSEVSPAPTRRQAGLFAIVRRDERSSPVDAAPVQSSLFVVRTVRLAGD